MFEKGRDVVVEQKGCSEEGRGDSPEEMEDEKEEEECGVFWKLLG